MIKKVGSYGEHISRLQFRVDKIEETLAKMTRSFDELRSLIS